MSRPDEDDTSLHDPAVTPPAGTRVPAVDPSPPPSPLPSALGLGAASLAARPSSTCMICASAQDERELLCAACRAALPRPQSFCPEQIQSRTYEQMCARIAGIDPNRAAEPADPIPLAAAESHALLIDPFGRPHLVSSTDGRRTAAYPIGRSRRCPINIAEMHVSRLHAYVEYREHSGAWFVRHSSEHNQTRINNRLVEHFPMPLDSGHKLIIGPVAFYFRELAPDEFGWMGGVLAELSRNLDPLYPSFVTQAVERTGMPTSTAYPVKTM
ncbi:MAG: FHA domain-containing protein [Myxococcota bacterium]